MVSDRRDTAIIFCIWLLGLACIVYPREICAEPMTIGFPEFSQELNLLSSSDPAAVFVRAAVTAPLMLPFDAGRQGEGEVLSDYFRANPDYTVWSVRIRSDSYRSDGGPVEGADVTSSLQRCAKAKGLPGLRTVTSRTEDSGPRGSERWVDLTVDKMSAEQVQALMTRIGECPVLEAKSSAVFGQFLGRGANLIGTGAYRILDFMPAKRFELRRVKGVAEAKKKLPKELVIRGFSDSMSALNSIRVGGVSGFFTDDEEVLARAAKDETLLLDRCRNGITLVYRRGVSIPCFERLGVTDIKDIG